MKNILIIGINTRALVNSCLKLNYNIFSTSYFKTSDFPDIENVKCILDESKNKTSGTFEQQFNPKNLLKESEDYLEIADHIILQSGITSNDFEGKYSKYKKKILGNKNIENVENKFKFYNKIKNKYLTPATFYLNDIYEAIEINKNYPDKQFILKPTSGSGGYNTNLLNNDSLNQINNAENGWILQEYISGTTVSSSVFGIKNNAQHLVNSRLLTTRDFGHENKFLYIGNITPFNSKIDPNANSLNKEMIEISESLIKDFKLIGSNGVDFIANENGLYVIEINPRIQGTYECCENTFEINMLDYHINACKGNLSKIPPISQYCYKKIIYANKTSKFTPLPFKNLYDLPHVGSITEKGEPLLTIIDKNSNLKKLIDNVNNISLKIENLEKTN